MADTVIFTRVRQEGSSTALVTVPGGQAPAVPSAKTRVVNGVLQYNQGTDDAPNWTNTVSGDQGQ